MQIHVNSTGEPGERRDGSAKPASLLGKQPHLMSQPRHHPCCEGEYILFAVTDMTEQLTWIMPVSHADTPHPHVETWADVCS